MCTNPDSLGYIFHQTGIHIFKIKKVKKLLQLIYYSSIVEQIPEMTILTVNCIAYRLQPMLDEFVSTEQQALNIDCGEISSTLVY